MSSNPYKFSIKQEKEYSKKIKGKQTASSGRFSEKGDVRLKDIVRIDNKCTTKLSYSIKLKDIQAFKSQVIGHGENWAYQVSFLNDKDKSLEDIVIISDHFFRELLENYRETI